MEENIFLIKESTIENWIHLYKMYGEEALNKFHGGSTTTVS